MKAESENFTDWSYGTAVCDAHGEPLMAFHGTTRVFDQFSKTHLGDKTQAADAKAGFFFAENPGAADQFTWENGDKCGHIIPVFLSIKNPFYSDHVLCGATGTQAGKIINEAKISGYDGVIFRDSDMLGHVGATYVVFEPSQVRFAIGNQDAILMKRAQEARRIADQAAVHPRPSQAYTA